MVLFVLIFFVLAIVAMGLSQGVVLLARVATGALDRLRHRSSNGGATRNSNNMEEDDDDDDVAISSKQNGWLLDPERVLIQRRLETITRINSFTVATTGGKTASSAPAPLLLQQPHHHERAHDGDEEATQPPKHRKVRNRHCHNGPVAWIVKLPATATVRSDNNDDDATATMTSHLDGLYYIFSPPLPVHKKSKDDNDAEQERSIRTSRTVTTTGSSSTTAATSVFTATTSHNMARIPSFPPPPTRPDTCHPAAPTRRNSRMTRTTTVTAAEEPTRAPRPTTPRSISLGDDEDENKVVAVLHPKAPLDKRAMLRKNNNEDLAADDNNNDGDGHNVWDEEKEGRDHSNRPEPRMETESLPIQHMDKEKDYDHNNNCNNNYINKNASASLETTVVFRANKEDNQATMVRTILEEKEEEEQLHELGGNDALTTAMTMTTTTTTTMVPPRQQSSSSNEADISFHDDAAAPSKMATTTDSNQSSNSPPPFRWADEDQNHQDNAVEQLENDARADNHDHVHVHDDNDDDDDNHATQCSICLLPYQVGDIVAWSYNAQCPHAYHADCLLDWLHTPPDSLSLQHRRQRNDSGHTASRRRRRLSPPLPRRTCPHCRQEYMAGTMVNRMLAEEEE